jgi:hypothetical protein
MISTATVIAILKSQASLALLTAALLNFVTTERSRQFELTRELGTLACQIDNRRMLGQDCSALQRQYDELVRLVK